MRVRVVRTRTQHLSLYRDTQKQKREDALDVHHSHGPARITVTISMSEADVYHLEKERSLFLSAIADMLDCPVEQLKTVMYGDDSEYQKIN